MINDFYLTHMDADTMYKHGISKVLLVRNEIIHIKHLMTDIFVRRVVSPESFLLGYSLVDYIEFLTNRIRAVHNFPRDISTDPNAIVKDDRSRFFPTIELVKDTNAIIALDFDGVITSKKFRELYKLCCERARVFVVTANPTVSNDYFDKHGLDKPDRIFAMKGKHAKLKQLIELQRKFDYVFYVDNEPMYLDVMWWWGVRCFHYTNGKIKCYTLNTK